VDPAADDVEAEWRAAITEGKEPLDLVGQRLGFDQPRECGQGKDQPAAEQATRH
jgi:hypothetical protein